MRISEPQRTELAENLKVLEELPRQVIEFLLRMGFVQEEYEASEIDREAGEIDGRELPRSMERLAVLGQRFQHYRSRLRPGVSTDTSPSKPTGPPPGVAGLVVPRVAPTLSEESRHLMFPHFGAGDGSGSALWRDWKVESVDADAALDGFMGIRNAQDALAFGTTYGPLWACSIHAPRQDWESPCMWHHGNRADARGASHSWENPEPVDWWLQAAGALRLAVTASTRLDNGEPLSRDELRRLGDDPDTFEQASEILKAEMGWEPDPVGAARPIVAAFIETHLDKYGVGLGVSGRWDVDMRSGIGILPAVWLRALNRIAKGMVAVCQGCQSPYVRRKRAAKRGQANWCPRCRENGLDKRASDRRRRGSGNSRWINRLTAVE